MVIDSDAAGTACNWIYRYGHWLAIAVTLFRFGLRHRAILRRVRNAMLGSGGGGLVIYATVPAAPPRPAAAPVGLS